MIIGLLAGRLFSLQSHKTLFQSAVSNHRINKPAGKLLMNAGGEQKFTSCSEIYSEYKTLSGEVRELINSHSARKPMRSGNVEPINFVSSNETYLAEIAKLKQKIGEFLPKIKSCFAPQQEPVKEEPVEIEVRGYISYDEPTKPTEIYSSSSFEEAYESLEKLLRALESIEDEIQWIRTMGDPLNKNT